MDDYKPIETFLMRGDGYKASRVIAAERIIGEAAYALALVERWGMVAAIPDGEDTAGRQRMRLATPEELAERAIATTTALFAAFRAAGWLVESPIADQITKRDRATLAELAEGEE